MLEQIKRNFGYSLSSGDSELRNRKLKKSYVPLPKEDTLALSSASEGTAISAHIPPPKVQNDSKVARIRQMRVLSSCIFIDTKRNPIDSYILFSGMKLRNAVDQLSDCLDGSVPFARLFLPSGQAEISVKRDVQSGLVQVDVHEPHVTTTHPPVTKLSENDIDRINCLMRCITSDIYNSRQYDYYADGIGTKSRIIKFQFMAEATENEKDTTARVTV